MPHGAEPAHKPKPPEHVKPVESAKRGELKVLSGELTRRAKFIFDSVVSPLESRGTDRRRLVDKAAEYRIGLHGYWTFIRSHASDVFVYRSEGKTPELEKLNDSLKQVDKDLAKQLERWAEVSSPYAESYDVTGIKETGKELSDIIRAAGMQLKAQMEVKQSPEADRRNAFRAEMALGLSGLAEQVGSQMESLGNGETIPNVTIANETAELMIRAGQDDLKFKLETKFDTTSAALDALEKFTPEFVESKLKEHYSIDDQIAVLSETSPEFERLQRQLEKVGLLPFFEALAEHTGPRGDAELTAARDRLTLIKGELKKLKLDPEKRAAYLAERTTLLNTMLPKMQTLMEETVRQNTERLDKYQTNLRDSTDDFHDDPYDFWSKTKKKTLSQIEAVAGEETRKKLDEAFVTGDLSDKVGKWTDILTKDAKPDPKAMQSRASDVVTTADKYLERIEGVLKDADADDALRELKGQLVSALTAIKLSTAEHLTFQFKLGRFKN